MKPQSQQSLWIKSRASSLLIVFVCAWLEALASPGLAHNSTITERDPKVLRKSADAIGKLLDDPKFSEAHPQLAKDQVKLMNFIAIQDVLNKCKNNKNLSRDLQEEILSAASRGQVDPGNSCYGANEKFSDIENWITGINKEIVEYDSEQTGDLSKITSKQLDESLDSLYGQASENAEKELVNAYLYYRQRAIAADHISAKGKPPTPEQARAAMNLDDEAKEICRLKSVLSKVICTRNEISSIKKVLSKNEAPLLDNSELRSYGDIASTLKAKMSQWNTKISDLNKKVQVKTGIRPDGMSGYKTIDVPKAVKETHKGLRDGFLADLFKTPDGVLLRSNYMREHIAPALEGETPIDGKGGSGFQPLGVSERRSGIWHQWIGMRPEDAKQSMKSVTESVGTLLAAQIKSSESRSKGRGAVTEIQSQATTADPKILFGYRHQALRDLIERTPEAVGSALINHPHLAAAVCWTLQSVDTQKKGENNAELLVTAATFIPFMMSGGIRFLATHTPGKFTSEAAVGGASAGSKAGTARMLQFSQHEATRRLSLIRMVDGAGIAVDGIASSGNIVGYYDSNREFQNAIGSVAAGLSKEDPKTIDEHRRHWSGLMMDAFAFSPVGLVLGQKGVDAATGLVRSISSSSKDAKEVAETLALAAKNIRILPENQAQAFSMAMKKNGYDQESLNEVLVWFAQADERTRRMFIDEVLPDMSKEQFRALKQDLESALRTCRLT